ncbi:MAG: acyl carrier protein [Ardenticatenaceae bacterium]|nr:acyl carrier protein [Ardenticatenaceae bacterium]
MTTATTLKTYITDTLLNGKVGVELAPDDNLLLSGLIDSLAVMQLVKHVETENGIKIQAGEITLKNFKTINAIVNFVDRKKGS